VRAFPSGARLLDWARAAVVALAIAHERITQVTARISHARPRRADATPGLGLASRVNSCGSWFEASASSASTSLSAIPLT